MLGTIVNSVTIIICSLLGMFIKGADKFEKAIVTALGLAVFFMGTAGVVEGLNDANSSALLFFVFIVLGTLIGEVLKIDEKFNSLGTFLGNRFGSSDNFSKGFVTATLIYCVGAMSIVGAFEGSLTGDHSILYAKSVIDGVTSFILASMYGIGVLFSAFAVFIYQGAFTVLAGFLSPIITADSIRELSTIGNVLIAAIGLDVAGIVKIKYANMLPAVFIPLVYYSPIFSMFRL